MHLSLCKRVTLELQQKRKYFFPPKLQFIYFSGIVNANNSALFLYLCQFMHLLLNSIITTTILMPLNKKKTTYCCFSESVETSDWLTKGDCQK